MPVRKKAANAVEIHRVEKPGGIVAIYERHDDGRVTRRVEKDARQTSSPDRPAALADVTGGHGGIAIDFVPAGGDAA